MTFVKSYMHAQQMISHISYNAHQHVNMGGEGSLSNIGIIRKLLFPVDL